MDPITLIIIIAAVIVGAKVVVPLLRLLASAATSFLTLAVFLCGLLYLAYVFVG